MFALAHKETGKFIGWDVFSSYINGEEWSLVQADYSDNVWCLESYVDIQTVLKNGEHKASRFNRYSHPDVDFPLDDYEIVVLTGIKV